MQVGTLAIQHLFEKDVFYRVPLYQRPYVWTEEEQWIPLWEDIRRIAELLLDGGNPRAHFLGATVQDRVAVAPGQIETRLLIDGQQRMTTIQLVLKAFGDVVRAIGQERYAEAIGKLTRNRHPLSTEASEAFKVWPTNADRNDFSAAMDCDGRDQLLRDYGAIPSTRAIGRMIVDAYLYFSHEIEVWLRGEERRVAALYGAVRDNVRLVVIDLDEKDDAQLIFETLNARGTPLLAADLVKNAILSEIQQSGGNTELAYQKYWQPFDYDAPFWRALSGRGHAQRARIETFLQHALTIRTGSEVLSAHLYAAYRDYAKQDDAGSPLERLDAFRRYGSIYKALIAGHEQPRIALFLERIGVLGLETIYPFLIKMFDRLGEDEAAIVAIVRELESFLVRRMVCRLSTRGYATLFIGLLDALDERADGIPSAVHAALLTGTAETDRWPDDAELRRAWMNNPLYENLTRPRLRMVLEAIEGGLRNDFAESDHIPRNLQIEHVMPISWQTYWPLAADAVADAATTRHRLVHTIGNLTLLKGKLNAVQSNRPWRAVDDCSPGKRDELAAHTTLHLNKALCHHDNWDDDAISERGAILFAVAQAVWPRPAGD